MLTPPAAAATAAAAEEEEETATLRTGSFDKGDADFFLGSDDDTVPSPSNPLLELERRGRVLLIIFDWDDTFLPTTILRDCSKSPCLRMPQTPAGITIDGPEIDDALKEEFADLAQVAARTLEVARGLGDVSLITNGSSDWIRSSCKKYLPSLWPVVNQFRRVSAKDLAQLHSRDPVEWKKRTFCTELNSYFSALSEQNASDPYKVVISVGDSFHERQALYHFHATTSLERVCIRSVKFVPLPNCAKLKAQHQALACHLAGIANLTPSCRAADLRYYFLLKGQDASARLHSLLDESDLNREQLQSVGEATPSNRPPVEEEEEEEEDVPVGEQQEDDFSLRGGPTVDDLVWSLHRNANGSPKEGGGPLEEEQHWQQGEPDEDETRSSVMSLFLNKASKILKTGFAAGSPTIRDMVESPFGLSPKDAGARSMRLATQLSEGNPMLVVFSDGLEFVD